MASPQNVLPDPHQLFPIPSYINVMSNSNSVLCRLVITLRSPKYLRKLVTSTADVLGRAKLRSACHGDPRRASFMARIGSMRLRDGLSTLLESILRQSSTLSPLSANLKLFYLPKLMILILFYLIFIIFIFYHVHCKPMFCPVSGTIAIIIYNDCVRWPTHHSYCSLPTDEMLATGLYICLYNKI